ncbi:MAG: (P)ppGpp synthetase I (GTP pyrophosphokinase), SpoT/RelA, partial [Parcubacteria group bacterium GW2011_GWF1_52_5]
KENEEFLENLKMDFFQDRIFVFTPKGDVVELPEGASVLDFAFCIHSDIGMHASAATVSGKYSPLDYKLKSGDIVKIETKKTSRPSHKWLDYVKTSMARKHIRMSLMPKKEED